MRWVDEDGKTPAVEPEVVSTRAQLSVEDGKVVLALSTPVGVAFYWFPPAGARALASGLAAKADEIRSIILPNRGDNGHHTPPTDAWRG